MLTLMFEKLGHRDEELKQTNLSIRWFSGESAEARGILSAKLTVGSKTLPTAFFCDGGKWKIQCPTPT
jgi:hypothetical protein